MREFAIKFKSHDDHGSFSVWLVKFRKTERYADGRLPLHCRLHCEDAKIFKDKETALRVLGEVRSEIAKRGFVSDWHIDDNGQVHEF